MARGNTEDLGVNERRLKWIKWDEEPWTDFSGSEYRQMAGTCECSNQLSDSIK